MINQIRKFIFHIFYLIYYSYKLKENILKLRKIYIKFIYIQYVSKSGIFTYRLYITFNYNTAVYSKLF